MATTLRSSALDQPLLLPPDLHGSLREGYLTLGSTRAVERATVRE